MQLTSSWKLTSHEASSWVRQTRQLINFQVDVLVVENMKNLHWLAIGPLHDPLTCILQNHTCWWASCAVGLPKQRNFQLDWYELHCFGNPSAQLAHQHISVLYHVTRSCKGPAVWPDPFSPCLMLQEKHLTQREYEFPRRRFMLQNLSASCAWWSAIDLQIPDSKFFPIALALLRLVLFWENFQISLVR